MRNHMRDVTQIEKVERLNCALATVKPTDFERSCSPRVGVTINKNLLVLRLYCLT